MKDWIKGLIGAIDARERIPLIERDDALIPEFAELSDKQVHALLDATIKEGSRRGFGSWWWE